MAVERDEWPEGGISGNDVGRDDNIVEAVSMRQLKLRMQGNGGVDVLTLQQLSYIYRPLLPQQVYIYPSSSPCRGHSPVPRKAYETARTLMYRGALRGAGLSVARAPVLTCRRHW